MSIFYTLYKLPYSSLSATAKFYFKSGNNWNWFFSKWRPNISAILILVQSRANYMYSATAAPIFTFWKFIINISILPTTPYQILIKYRNNNWNISNATPILKIYLDYVEYIYNEKPFFCFVNFCISLEILYMQS